MTCEDWKGTIPVLFVSEVHELQEPRSPTRGGRDLMVCLKALNSTTNPLTAAALIYAFGAGITAGAGTRLVLQLLLDFGWV